MSEVQALRPGDPDRLGRYRLLGRIGQGGQGVVFLGESSSGERVAVKLIQTHLGDDTSARNRFVQELAAAKRVARFCTAQVLEADVEGDRPFIASEYVEGLSLSSHVESFGPLTGGALDRLAIGTATALFAIHQANVVHRDFKPHNVMLGPDGPRVIDFGIAKALDSATTQSSSLVGTPAFMSPEQVSWHPTGPPADVFAWGVTMVFAATGRLAFGRDSLPLVVGRILHGQPDLGGMSGPLRDLVADALAKDPAARPTAGDLLTRLLGARHNSVDMLEIGVAQAAQSPGNTTPLPVIVRPPRRLRTRVLLAAGVAVALVAGVVSVVLLNSGQADSVADIAHRALPAIVTVELTRADGDNGTGSGFILEGGYIITNNHVIDQEGGKLKVVLNDKRSVPVKVVGRDQAGDVALLKPTRATVLPEPLRLGNSDEIAVGDPVVGVGSPLGFSGSVTTGIVSALDRAIPGPHDTVLNTIQTSVTASPGSSGGPLLNAGGRVIGIINSTAAVDGQSPITFAIPVNQARFSAEYMISHRGRAPQRPALGLSMDTTYTGTGVRIGTEPQDGVDPVVSGGPAENAGLLPGDLITAADGVPIKGPADLLGVLARRKPGDILKLTYMRDGTQNTVPVTLGKTP